MTTLEALSTACSVVELRSLYKEAARVAHPDAGGSSGDFQELAAAYEARAAALAALVLCPRCEGSGRIEAGHNGFTYYYRCCPCCAGARKITLEERLGYETETRAT
jgi:DnaJ-class molecular chaperone